MDDLFLLLLWFGAICFVLGTAGIIAELWNVRRK